MENENMLVETVYDQAIETALNAENNNSGSKGFALGALAVGGVWAGVGIYKMWKRRKRNRVEVGPEGDDN